MSVFWTIVNFAVNSVAILFVALMVIDIISFYFKAFISFLLSYDFFARWKMRIELKIVIWKFQIREQLKEWWEWWKNLSGLKRVYFLLAIPAFIALVYALRTIFPKFIDQIVEMQGSFSDLSIAVFASLSGIGAVFGFYTSILRTETAEQGLITDRINKATEGLGKNNEKGDAVIEVRLGALYALERVAQDSIRDHISVMEILCAYIHHNSPKDAGIPEHQQPVPLRKDIQAALTIIGRREKWVGGKKRIRKEKQQNYSLDLRNCNLRAAELEETYLKQARFYNTDLSYAKLGKANLSYAYFQFANLFKTDCNETNMSNTILTEANLANAGFFLTNMRCACFDDAIMNNTLFLGAIMDGAHAQKCDLSKANIISAKQLEQMYCGIDVILPEDEEDNRPKHWPTTRQMLFDKNYKEWLEKKDPLLFISLTTT